MDEDCNDTREREFGNKISYICAQRDLNPRPPAYEASVLRSIPRDSDMWYICLKCKSEENFGETTARFLDVCTTYNVRYCKCDDFDTII